MKKAIDNPLISVYSNGSNLLAKMLVLKKPFKRKRIKSKR